MHPILREAVLLAAVLVSMGCTTRVVVVSEDDVATLDDRDWKVHSPPRGERAADR